VVGSDKKDFWYVVNAQTGQLMSKIQTPSSQAAHNLNLSTDGRWAFMSPIGKVMSIADMVFRAGKLQRVANQFGNGVAADGEH